MVRISFQDVLQTSTAPFAILGAKANTPDGSTWVYVKLNEACLKGHVVAPVALTHVDTVSSSANGAGQIVYITEASAGWTVGKFNDAWVNVDDGTGEGQIAKVKTNTTDTLELYPQWALGTALAVADSDIDISTVNTLSEKVPVTTTTTFCNGAAQVAFAQNDYGWVLAKGPGIVISGTAAMTLEKNFTPGDDTEGEVVIGVTAKGDFDAFTLGYSLSANTTADKGFLACMGIQTV
jgi:hypothetical protein